MEERVSRTSRKGRDTMATAADGRNVFSCNQDAGQKRGKPYRGRRCGRRWAPLAANGINTKVVPRQWLFKDCRHQAGGRSLGRADHVRHEATEDRSREDHGQGDAMLHAHGVRLPVAPKNFVSGPVQTSPFTHDDPGEAQRQRRSGRGKRSGQRPRLSRRLELGETGLDVAPLHCLREVQVS